MGAERNASCAQELHQLAHPYRCGADVCAWTCAASRWSSRRSIAVRDCNSLRRRAARGAKLSPLARARPGAFLYGDEGFPAPPLRGAILQLLALPAFGSVVCECPGEPWWGLTGRSTGRADSGLLPGERRRGAPVTLLAEHLPQSNSAIEGPLSALQSIGPAQSRRSAAV